MARVSHSDLKYDIRLCRVTDPQRAGERGTQRREPSEGRAAGASRPVIRP